MSSVALELREHLLDLAAFGLAERAVHHALVTFDRRNRLPAAAADRTLGPCQDKTRRGGPRSNDRHRSEH